MSGKGNGYGLRDLTERLHMVFVQLRGGDLWTFLLCVVRSGGVVSFRRPSNDIS